MSVEVRGGQEGDGQPREKRDGVKSRLSLPSPTPLLFPAEDFEDVDMTT